MANTVKLNQDEMNIQGLIGQYLAARPTDLDLDSKDAGHVDQDTMTAFVEGTLNARESQPVIGHLVRCSFCRHISAELIRLDMQFSETPAAETLAEEAPTRISEVLSGLFSKIFGTSDGAVFAHTEEDEPKKEEEDGKEND